MKTVAFLLIPFSWIYSSVLWLRNFLFDKGVFISVESPLPTIVIGNLEFGGTGKTPVTDYVLKRLAPSKRVGLLSRGYGRKTQGFITVEINDNALMSGDEPLMLKIRNPEVSVAVCENRFDGIEKMLRIYESLDFIVADDAMQHRRLVGKLNLLCTLWDKPFFSNRVFPAGTLRDHPVRAGAAEIILVNKCPNQISDEQLTNFKKRIPKSLENKKFVFTYLRYSPLESASGTPISTEGKKIVLLTGIARPYYLVRYVQDVYGPIYRHLKYSDHHLFSNTDLNLIEKFTAPEFIILTTEKDLMRLAPFQEKKLRGLLIVPVKIELGFHADGQKVLDTTLAAIS